MWASQLPQDLRLLRADESAAQNEAIANRVFQYQGDDRPLASPVATGVLEREAPFEDLRLSQKLEQLAGHSVLLSPGDKEAVRRFLAEGCWQGMSATDVRAIQKLLTQALSPAQQTQMGLSIDDIRQITYVESLMGTRHEPLSETAAQMRDELLASQGISENEQKFRSSLHLIDTQADGVRVLADELLRTGQLTPQSSLKEIAEKSLALVQTRFNYIKEPNDPDGTEQDRWQSIAETMRKGGGDCEDLAMLQASLLMNLMEQMGYSKKDIRERVFISGGYMSDAAGNQKGHVLVRLQMDDGDLALDATGNSAPSRFDGLNFDVVFEANDWTFNKLQEIDPAFVTALNVNGSAPDSIVDRINELMALLEIQLQTPIDIPLPLTTGNDDFFGNGSEDVMQKRNAAGELETFKETTKFTFFTMKYEDYGPVTENNWIYSAEINSDAFLKYVTVTRNLTNEILMLYHIGNSYLDFVANEATEIGLSGYDEETKGAMQNVMDSGDKYKGKMIGAMNNFLQKSNNYIQQVSSQVFQFVESNNSAQLQMAQYKIDSWSRENLLNALGTAVVDELLNVLAMIRIKEKVNITNKMAKLTADNMTAYLKYSKDMTENLRLWSESTSQADVTSEGPMNYGKKVWNDMEGSDGLKGAYMTYLDKVQAQVDKIKNGMTTAPSYTATYGLSQANMNQGRLQGDLLAAHGASGQYVQANMDQMAKLLEHNAKFQNMVGIALLIQQAINDGKKEVAISIGGKKSTSSSGQLSSVAMSSLGAELAKQSAALQSVKSAVASVANQATDLMTQRLNYQKETITTSLKAVKMAAELTGYASSLISSVTAGASSALAASTAFALPYTAAIGAAALLGPPGIPTVIALTANAVTTGAAAGVAYGTLWTDYWERTIANGVSAAADVVYSAAQLISESQSHEAGTTRFIQEGLTYGRSKNGASASGGPLAKAKAQTNTAIWSNGEREYYTNRTIAKVLKARDSYNMQTDSGVRVDIFGSNASGTRNTERTEFIHDMGNGQVVLNGFLMGSREAGVAMSQGQVYALVGIFRAQRDAMENIMNQMFGVQKASKANAMGEQINRSVGFEEQLVGIYKQDSQQRMQAMEMMLKEDKLFRDASRDVTVSGLQAAVTLTEALTSFPIPAVALPNPVPGANTISDAITLGLVSTAYYAAATAYTLARSAISIAEAVYKYDVGAYSDAGATYHDRTLNTEEAAYRDALNAARVADTPSANGMDAPGRYARLDLLEKKQLAKMVNYGGGVGEWGSGIGGNDSILEASNSGDVPFRQVNYDTASKVYAEITNINALRIFYAMIEQALYQQKQNVFRAMFGTSSSAGHIDTMMRLMDTHNSAVLNGTFESLLQEAGSRVTSSNAYENNIVTKSIEYATVGVVSALNTPIAFRVIKPLFGLTGEMGARKNTKVLTGIGGVVRLMAGAAKIGFGFYLMYSVKVSNVSVDSSMATYDEENGDPSKKTVTDPAQSITKSAGGQQRVSAANKNRAQIMATRRERQITLMREISLALADATADAAEDVGGVSSSKSFKGILTIIGQFAGADRKQAEFTFQALKQQAEAYNRGVEKVMEGSMTILTEAIKNKVDNMKSAAGDKKETAKKIEGPGKKQTSESAALRKSGNTQSAIAGVLSALSGTMTQATIETLLWVLASIVNNEPAQIFATEDGDEDSKADDASDVQGGKDDNVANTDDLENALLRVSLMQANVAILNELLSDRVSVASKAGSSMTKAIKDKIKERINAAVEDRKAMAAEKDEKAKEALTDLSEDELGAKLEKFEGVAAAGANAIAAISPKNANDLTKEEQGNAAIQRNVALRRVVAWKLGLKDASGKPDLKAVTDEKIGEVYGQMQSRLTDLDKKGSREGAAILERIKDSEAVRTERDNLKSELALFDAVTKDQGEAAENAIKTAMKQLTPEERREYRLLQSIAAPGDSAEKMSMKLQDMRAEKGQAEGREAAGSQTFAQAKAGMASKDGLASVRKQQFELGKLEASLFLGEAARIDEATPGDGDPGESDPDRRDNKKDALDKYVKDGSLNAAFDALDEKSQIAALVTMGVSKDSAAERVGNRALKKELQDLNQDMQSVLSGGKVDQLESLSRSDMTSPTVMWNRRKATAARDKYVGADGRLNRNFYDLGKNEQDEARRAMGVSENTAAKGTQAYQDEKMASIKAKVAALTAKVGSRLDTTDVKLTRLRDASQSLPADLDLGQRTFADVAKTAKEKEVGVSESYIAADGSIKSWPAEDIQDSVPLLLSDNTGNTGETKIVYVDKGQLETLDLNDKDTQTKLGKLEGLTEWSVVSVSDPAALQGYQKKAGELKALPGEMAALSTAKKKDLGTLRTLGRLSAMGQAREVEALGLESLHREQGVTIDDLEFESDMGALSLGEDGSPREAVVRGALQSAGLITADGKVSAKASRMSEAARNEAIDEALGIKPESVLTPQQRAEQQSVRGVLGKGAERRDSVIGALKRAGLVNAQGNITDVVKGKSVKEIEALIEAVSPVLPEKDAIVAVLSGKKNQEKQDAIAEKIANLTDDRAADRNAIRKEMSEINDALAKPLDWLSAADKSALQNDGIIDKDGKVNPERRAALIANPADADALFAAVPGLDPKSEGALKSKVLGEKEQEKLSQLEKRLKGLEDAVLAPGESLSARENLAASDAASSPDAVRAQLQAQGAAVSQYILTRKEAKENMQPSMMEALRSKGDSVSDFAARMTGGAVVRKRTEKEVSFVEAVFANVSHKDRRQAKKDFKNAARAEAAGLDREAVSERFQDRVDQLTGAASGVRMAGAFVKKYKSSVEEAEKAKKEAEKAKKKGVSPWLHSRIGEKMGKVINSAQSVLGVYSGAAIGGAAAVVASPFLLVSAMLDRTDEQTTDKSKVASARDHVLAALVVERDATDKIESLLGNGKLGAAASVLRNIASSGPEGQALAAGILRRMAATAPMDNVRDLVDAAATGATANQLRGLGNAFVQATERDTRFDGVVITNSAFTDNVGVTGDSRKGLLNNKDASGSYGDQELGRLYGLSGWHTDKAVLGDRTPIIGKSIQTVQKAWTGASSASQKSGLGASNLRYAVSGSTGLAKAMAGMSTADLVKAKKELGGDSGIGALLKGAADDPDVGEAIQDSRISKDTVANGPSDKTADRQLTFDAFEAALSNLLAMPDSPSKLTALSNAVDAFNKPGSGGIAAATTLLDRVTPDGAVPSQSRQDIRAMSGKLISKVGLSLQSEINDDLQGLSAESAAPLVTQSKDFVDRSRVLLDKSRGSDEVARLKNVAAVLGKLEKVEEDLNELKSLTKSGLDASFSEASVRSDYFKKLNDAVEGEGTRAQEKMKREAEKKAEPLPVSSSVTALAEIMQKLDKDPAGAGAELEKVKDRVARVVKEAVSQGHVEDVMRVLGKLRQTEQISLIQDLGTLLAQADESEKFKQDLIEYDKRVNEGVVQRSEEQQARREALETFVPAMTGSKNPVLDQLVQGLVNTKQKQVALDTLADRLVSGDTTLLEQSLTDQVLRQDLAQLVAEGVALDIPSAYKLLDKVAKLNSKESEAFAESLGAYLVVVNRETKTESRKGDVKKIREHLQSLSKEDADKKQAAAFVTQISNGYGMQLYTVSSAVGRPSTSVSKALDTLVQKGGAQKVQAQTIFRAFALNNPRAAGNLMTEAMRSTTPNLATTLYEGVEKEIPGANGRTLDGLQSLITISLAALDKLPPLSAELTTLKTKMEANLVTLATKKGDSPPVPAAITSHIQVMDDSLGVPEDQKALVGEQLKQGLQSLADKLVTVASEGDFEVLTEVFGKLESNPAGMTESDFDMLNDLASALPPTTAREVRLQLGMAAMLALPEGRELRADIQDQQVADMIATGQGRMFSSEMVSNMLASNASGKLDALEALLKNDSPSLVLSDDTMSHILDALDDLSADGAQCNRLLEFGGDLSFKVTMNFDKTLSAETIRSFSTAQADAGVTLSPDNVDTLRANFSAIATGTGTVVTDAKPQILEMLNSPAQCALLKKEEPALYLSMLSLAVGEGVSSGDMSLSRDMDSVAAYQGEITAHMADPGSIHSLDLMQANLVTQFVNRDPRAATALALIGATNPAAISSLLCNMDGIDSGELANQIQLMAISPSGNQDMSALLNAVPALREKAAVGPHIVLRKLAQAVLTKHNRGASFEGELAAMGSHVRMHADSFVTALKKSDPTSFPETPEGATAAQDKIDACLSSESGLTGMITLLDAQAKTLKKNTPDARNMTAAKQSLSEVRVGELIRNDDENIAGMDRGDATILVDTLRAAKASIMPHLAPQLKSAEAVDRLTALIGQSNHGLGGDMQALRGELMTATGLLNMNDVNIAADSIGAMPPDLAVGTLSNYKNQAMAVAVFNLLGVAQKDAILSRMVPSHRALFEP